MRFIARASRPLQPNSGVRVARRRTQAAKAAVALLIIENGVQQIGAPEIRPQRFGDVQLGIGDLPQQEIADAHFAGGPDQKIGIGQAGGVKPRGDGFFVDAQIAQTPFRRASSTIALTASTSSARPL